MGIFVYFGYLLTMRNLIKRILSEQIEKKELLVEAVQDWCQEFAQYGKIKPQYQFCKAADKFIRDELEDAPVKGRGKPKKKIFVDFEKGLEKFFKTNMDDETVRKNLIQIETTSPVFIEGKNEIDQAAELLSANCPNFKKVTDKKLEEFENRVILYFMDENGGYSFENRLPTNYSALAVLFTKFFLEKGAFGDQKYKVDDWNAIAKNWITHSFNPSHKFIDIRSEEDKSDVSQTLSSLDFQELANIYFKGSRTFNSQGIRNSVMEVLKGVRGKGFETEDEFQMKYLDGKKEFYRFAKDYGFVDMFGGVDFIYKSNDGMWVPIQVKTTAMEPTYLISRMGCKTYIIADKKGKKFEMAVFPRQEFLPD